MKRAVLIFFCLLGIALSMSTSAAQAIRRYEAQFLSLFDTLTTVVGYSLDRDVFSQQVEEIYKQLSMFHKQFDIYNSYDNTMNLKDINDNAGMEPCRVDPEMQSFLTEAKQWYELTHGKFNFAMGRVLSIWHDYREQGMNDPLHAELPSLSQLREAARHMDPSKLQIDADRGTVQFLDGEMRLDVGAFAKGYALEQASQAVERNFTVPLLISVGGNVRAIGTPVGSGTTLWRVGIPNPRAPGQDLCVVGLKPHQALASSGGYFRHYTVQGKQYHHIIDPDTLFPSDRYLSVTVLSNDAGMSDVLSTALFNLPYASGRALMESFPDTGAMWVFPDSEIRYGGNFYTAIIESH